MLYVSVGSTCKPATKAILRTPPSFGSSLTAVLGRCTPLGCATQSALRSIRPAAPCSDSITESIGWAMTTRAKNSMRIVEGRQYGWPYIYADHKRNPQDEPPGDIT